MQKEQLIYNITMIAIPLYTFFILYLLVVLAFGIIYFVHLYHLVATGSVTLLSIAVALLVGGMMILILSFTFLALADISWTASIPIINTSWFPGVFSPKTF